MLRPRCPKLCVYLVWLLSNKSFRGFLINTCICPSITNSPNLPKHSSSRQVFLLLFSFPDNAPLTAMFLCECSACRPLTLCLSKCLPVSQWRTNPTLLCIRYLFVLAQSFSRDCSQLRESAGSWNENTVMLSFLFFWKARNIEFNRIVLDSTIWKYLGKTDSIKVTKSLGLFVKMKYELGWKSDCGRTKHITSNIFFQIPFFGLPVWYCCMPMWEIKPLMIFPLFGIFRLFVLSFQMQARCMCAFSRSSSLNNSSAYPLPLAMLILFRAVAAQSIAKHRILCGCFSTAWLCFQIVSTFVQDVTQNETLLTGNGMGPCSQLSPVYSTILHNSIPSQLTSSPLD